MSPSCAHAWTGIVPSRYLACGLACRRQVGDTILDPFGNDPEDFAVRRLLGERTEPSRDLV